MSDKSYDEPAQSQSSEPSVFQAKVAILLGHDEQKNIIAERSVAGEMISRDGGEPRAHVAISDTIDLLMEAILSLGEDICDQIGMSYTKGMPNFLDEFGATMGQIEYDDDDNVRQAANREAMNMAPLD